MTISYHFGTNTLFINTTNIYDFKSICNRYHIILLTFSLLEVLRNLQGKLSGVRQSKITKFPLRGSDSSMGKMGWFSAGLEAMVQLFCRLHERYNMFGVVFNLSVSRVEHIIKEVIGTLY